MSMRAASPATSETADEANPSDSDESFSGAAHAPQPRLQAQSPQFCTPTPQRTQTRCPQSTDPTYMPDVLFKICVECEDQSAEVICFNCQENFCRPCWSFQHRRGKRSEHRTEAILGDVIAAPRASPVQSPSDMRQQAEPEELTSPNDELMLLDHAPPANEYNAETNNIGGAGERQPRPGLQESEQESRSMMDLQSNGALEAATDYETLKRKAAARHDASSPQWHWERAKCIPMRLTEDERMLLRVLQSALNVSEYTDRVDTTNRYRYGFNSMIGELELLLGTIIGLIVCSDPPRGHDLIEKGTLAHADFFRDIFEVGRRYKIMNPDKLRNPYGKLMYMLQDTQHRSVQQAVGFSCVKPILTVTSFLEERDAAALLQDPRVQIAGKDVGDGGGRFSREEVAKQIDNKQRAAQELKDAFASDQFSPGDVQRVLDSIADSYNYLIYNARPVRHMLEYLRDEFDPVDPGLSGFSLAIGGASSRFYKSRTSSASNFSLYGGSYGSPYFKTDTAKLCHDHATHFTYVGQSLRLWKELMQHMYRLWWKADADLLNLSSSYQLVNTGQGLNRVQNCPLVSGEMRRILGIVQRDTGPWVGLSVVHLGDRDVPNALMFIDKYTQVPRILSPLARFIDQCSGLFQNEALRVYAEEVWTSPDNLKKHVLTDFFRHAFDGDGDDGGSCIDGRLTSAWNWCSRIAKKPYYYAFMLSNFVGFDGDADSWKDK